MQMISGADIALWDIAGKAFNQPICKLLGAQVSRQGQSLRLYALSARRPMR